MEPEDVLSRQQDWADNWKVYIFRVIGWACGVLILIISVDGLLVLSLETLFFENRVRDESSESDSDFGRTDSPRFRIFLDNKQKSGFLLKIMPLPK